MCGFGMERRIPELYQDTDTGDTREAIMDMVVSWPASCQQWWIDVTVRSPFNTTHTGAWHTAGAAAAAGDRAKEQRYGERVLPLALEPGGRVSPKGLSCLRSLASASRDFGRRSPVTSRRGTTVRRLLYRVTTLVCVWAADVTLQSLGA